MNNPVVTLLLDNGGRVALELLMDEAPNTCCSFLWMARHGCYDGVAIDQLRPGFSLQPTLAAEHPEAALIIDGEFALAGFPNMLPLAKGFAAMDSDEGNFASGSEFFFVLGAPESKQGKYPVFARVTEGLAHIEDMAKLASTVEDDAFEPPMLRITAPVRIRAAEIETFGEQYPRPSKATPLTDDPGWIPNLRN